MAYERKTNHGINDHEALLRAVKEIKIDKKSIRSVCSKYGVSKTSMLRYLNRLDEQFDDISVVDKSELMDVLKLSSRVGSYKQVNLLPICLHFFQWIEHILRLVRFRFLIQCKRRIWLDTF